MKKSLYILLSLVALTGMTSCEKDLPVYSEETCWLNFYYATKSEVHETDYSFVYSGSSVTQDTVWVSVSTLGFVKDVDRPLALKQVETGENDAVAGTHYVSFDDESLKKYYYMPAGATVTKVPVVVLRDASLKTTAVNLQIGIKENENFKPGYEDNQSHLVTISDKLTKPSSWDDNYFDYYVSLYTKGVHQFMIDVTGEKWDDEYINKISTDSGYIQYLNTFFKKKLEEVNAARLAAGLGVLCEEDGTPVVIKTAWD